MNIDLSLHISCLQDNHCPIIVSRDAGSSCQHRAINKQRKLVRQFHIDGDVIPSNQPGKRCDFLLLNDDAQTAYFIELKGSDILYAVEQILATEANCRESLKGYMSFYRVIYRSATHALRSSKALDLKRRYQGRLVFKENLYEEAI